MRFPKSQINFLYCFLAGSVFVVIFSMAGMVVPLIMVPLVIIVVYAFWGDEGETDKDDFADTIYYLGFLFTLVSLVLALINYTTHVDGQSNVQSSFGLALVTTIVGLALKIFKTDTSVDLESQVSKMESSLLVGMESLSRSIYSMADRYKDLHTLHLSSVEDSINSSKSSFDQMVSATNKIFDDRLKAYEGVKAGFADNAAVRIKEVDRDIHGLISELAASVSAVSNKLETFTSSCIDSIEQGKTNIESVPKKIISSVSNLETAYSSVSRQIIELVEKFKANMENAMKDMSSNDLNQSFECLTQKMSDCGRSFDVFVEYASAFASHVDKIDEMQKVLTSHSESYNLSTSNMEAQLSNARKYREEIETEISKSKQALTAMYTDLVYSAKYIMDNIKH